MLHSFACLVKLDEQQIDDHVLIENALATCLITIEISAWLIYLYLHFEHKA